ncbi:MAG: hypothetical protein H6668_08655 [Ardenticatenaceae bacterium]|nr:hypothetical protein [Ardenticatenaceae bacterium]
MDKTWPPAMEPTPKLKSSNVHRQRMCDARGLLVDVIRNNGGSRPNPKPPIVRHASIRKPEALTSAKRLTVMRQVYFSTPTAKTIDMLLSLNGLPIATTEPGKTLFTGQRTHQRHPAHQRPRPHHQNPSSPKTRPRPLAVDTDEVYMTTCSLAASTFFLPSTPQQGRRGKTGGKGNPTQPPVHHRLLQTLSLGEQVAADNSWLDIIHRPSICNQRNPRLCYQQKRTRRDLIFPCCHQLDAARKLLAATFVLQWRRRKTISFSTVLALAKPTPSPDSPSTCQLQRG